MNTKIKHYDPLIKCDSMLLEVYKSIHVIVALFIVKFFLVDFLSSHSQPNFLA